MKIAVLGAGMVGRTIAIDLSTRFDVTSFDLDPNNLEKLMLGAHIKTVQTDLANYQDYPQMLALFDMVVCAVPGFMGYRTLEAVIKAGKNVVDISFFPEDGLQLNALALSMNVTAIIDCGVAPGMSNLILGRYNEVMKVNSFECLVGGLPRVRIKPFEYKAPFSPIDVIEEYTRPARYVENSNVVTRPALSDPELVHFDKAGTLESFNTDGLRSILFTMKHIPNLKEKTLRYPGHIQLITALQAGGFFSEEKILLNGNYICPLELTSEILFKQWKLESSDDEFTIMRILVSGILNDEQVTVQYLLYDENDKETSTSSMSRTTAYTCTAAVNMLADGLFESKGVFPPELIGKNENCFNYIISYLEKRNVRYEKSLLTN